MTTTHRTDSKVAKTAAPSIKAFDLSDYLDNEHMQALGLKLQTASIASAG